MNSRKSKLLFMLIDKIDERYIDEAWGGDDKEIYGNIDFSNIDYDSDMRRGVNVVLEHRPFRVFAPVVTAAACMLLFVAGGFTAVNIFRDELLGPNSRAENPASYIESSQSSDSSDEPPDPQDVISDIEPTGNYELQFLLPPGGSGWSEETEKLNNLGYAEIVITETKATPTRPIYVQILKSTPKAGMEPLSDSIAITGTGTYRIEYTTLRGAGSYSYLFLEYPNRNINGEYLVSGTEIIGTWSP